MRGLGYVFPRPRDPTHGIYNRKLLDALPEGHEARVIALWPWVRRLSASLVGILRGPDRPVGPGELPVAHPTFYYPPGRLRSLHGRLMWASSRAALRRMLADFAPDVVLSYWAYPDGEAAAHAARALGVPMALIVGGSDVLLLERQPARLRRRYIAALRSANVLLPVNRDLGSQLLALGVDPGRVHVLYQGVDAERFVPGDRAEARRRLGIPSDGPVLLGVGRMVPVKGLDVLLRAGAELRSRGLGIRLYLVGDGPLRASLEEQAAVLGLSGAVTFAGPRTQDELPDWYRA